MNHQGHNNIRNEIVWVQTSHSTCTCTVKLHVIETLTHQNFESLKSNNFRNDENRIRICRTVPKRTKSFGTVFGRTEYHVWCSSVIGFPSGEQEEPKLRRRTSGGDRKIQNQKQYQTDSSAHPTCHARKNLSFVGVNRKH